MKKYSALDTGASLYTYEYCIFLKYIRTNLKQEIKKTGSEFARVYIAQVTFLIKTKVDKGVKTVSHTSVSCRIP